ncbi:hypothetical protein FD755_016681 [Muntiacus reevesi]|uniref:Uncharacterized protein n=1 Tax=Muntiacus reevesi TaxID=9886 RepID=A0A5N3XH10_MUNRE|nr:hypothetical protein FD755_016681 [Muntiacus reevesi]
MAASTASQRPMEGILRNKSSTTSSLSKRSQKWDEMNILATSSSRRSLWFSEDRLPSTPSHSMVGDEADALSGSETAEALSPDILAPRRAATAAAESSEPKCRVSEPESSGDEEPDLSPEEGEKKKKRDRLTVKLARQLISKDRNDEEGDEEMSETAARESMDMEESSQGSATSDQLRNKSEFIEETFFNTVIVKYKLYYFNILLLVLYNHDLSTKIRTSYYILPRVK